MSNPHGGDGERHHQSVDEPQALAPGFRSRADAPANQPSPGVSIRTLVRGPWMEVVEYTVPKGFIAGAADYREYEKAGYMVRGKLEIATSDGLHIIETGGAYSLPRGVAHRFTVIEDSIIVQVRSPVLEGSMAIWRNA